MEIRLSNMAFMSRGAPFTCRGGIRFGGIRKVGEEDAIRHAATLAKESDGMYVFNEFPPCLTCGAAATILVIGLNHE
jgi:beta-glucosidase